MKYFALNLTAVSPLAIRADHAPDGVANARYIAGSALMGSLAAVYRLFHADRIVEFEELFLKEQIQYPNLYPATFQNALIQDAQLWPVYPPPQTAQTCKRYPGFDALQDDEDDERHGVRDSLFDWARFKLASPTRNARPPAELLTLLHDQKECPTCGRAMKSFSDFYRRSQSGKQQPMMSATPHTRVQTHTGIDRETGTVQESILYSREVFQERTRFWGMVKVPEELAEAFAGFVRDVGETGLVRVGTGRTRGMGKVHLSAQPLPDEQYDFAAFKQRLDAFNSTFRTTAAEAKLELDPFYFALTLHAPALLRDDLLRYRCGIDEETLAELTALPGQPGPPADSFRAIYQATSTRRVTGWNELWGMPRTNECAVETGSVFLFASRVEPGEDLLRALFRLEQEGIGQRRAEGFGQVCISDPFHLEVKLR